MFIKLRRLGIPLLVLAFGACDAPEPPVSPDTIARAAGVDFMVEEAAELLAPQTQLPNQPMVVDALASLWVDYFLLARTTAEDSTLSNLNVDPLVKLNADQEVVFRLRDEVVQVDTSFTEEEVRQAFESELPGARVRARHILLRIPVGATQAQQDSVQALAVSLRSRIEAGESFALLAGEFSQDPGSAPNGGDLGSFARGEMVPQFEEAAFSLQEGEVSDVVETSFGLHLIKVDERIIPSADENLDQFRLQLQNRRVMEAESTFVASVVEGANIQVNPDGFEAARELAHDPELELSRQAMNRTLVSFEGGKISIGEYRDWVELRAMGLRDQIRTSTDQQMEGLMQNLARERLLVRAAQERGIEVSAARRDSIATGIREGVRTVVRQIGFDTLRAATPQAADSVALVAVGEFLRAAVGEGREVVPLGGVSIALRRQYDARIFDTGLERTVARINELRVQLPMNPPQTDTPPGGDAPTPDSSGTTGGDGNP